MAFSNLAILIEQAINEKILSLNCGEFRAEIVTVDAQESLNGGVLVLVTGYLTGKDNLGRKFTQSFFLAPQEKGYFVLNDVFRYVEDTNTIHQNVNQAVVNTVVDPVNPVDGSGFSLCCRVHCFCVVRVVIIIINLVSCGNKCSFVQMLLLRWQVTCLRKQLLN